jgi:hypothetical protein
MAIPHSQKVHLTEEYQVYIVELPNLDSCGLQEGHRGVDATLKEMLSLPKNTDYPHIKTNIIPAFNIKKIFHILIHNILNSI